MCREFEAVRDAYNNLAEPSMKQLGVYLAASIEVCLRNGGSHFPSHWHPQLGWQPWQTSSPRLYDIAKCVSPLACFHKVALLDLRAYPSPKMLNLKFALVYRNSHLIACKDSTTPHGMLHIKKIALASSKPCNQPGHWLTVFPKRYQTRMSVLYSRQKCIGWCWQEATDFMDGCEINDEDIAFFKQRCDELAHRLDELVSSSSYISSLYITQMMTVLFDSMRKISTAWERFPSYCKAIHLSKSPSLSPGCDTPPSWVHQVPSHACIFAEDPEIGSQNPSYWCISES